MKVDSKVKFRPITLNLSFTDEKEAEAFYAIFNHSGICCFCEDYFVDDQAIREALNCDNKQVFSDLEGHLK